MDLDLPRLGERVESGEPHVNYALVPYAPVTDPVGKLRGSNLLFESFRIAGADPRWTDLCTATRSEWGLSGTVWGIKQVGGATQWELYYYRHWDDTLLTPARVSSTFSPLLDVVAVPDPGHPYWSISFDLDVATLRGEQPIRQLHVYQPHHHLEAPISCVSYGLDQTGLHLENLYFLFDPLTDLDDVREYLRRSLFVRSPEFDADQLLWEEMFPCDHVAFAHKPGRDGLYFGGIDIDQFLVFLERTGFEPWVAAYVRSHRDELDHLRLDAGFDFQVDGSGISIRKAGFYGAL